MLVIQVTNFLLIPGSLATPTLSPLSGDIFQRCLMPTRPGLPRSLSGTPSCSLSPVTLKRLQALWKSFWAVDPPLSDDLLQSAIVFQGLLQISCPQMSPLLVSWQLSWWEY